MLRRERVGKNSAKSRYRNVLYHWLIMILKTRGSYIKSMTIEQGKPLAEATRRSGLWCRNYSEWFAEEAKRTYE